MHKKNRFIFFSSFCVGFLRRIWFTLFPSNFCSMCSLVLQTNNPSFYLLGVQMGKVIIQQLGNDDFYCEHVTFSRSFLSGTPVRVFLSLNHGNESSIVHDSAFIWVEDVTTSGFKTCLVQGGQGNGGNTTIDWFAFQGPQSGVHHGETSFSLFTTGSKCKLLTFTQVWYDYMLGIVYYSLLTISVKYSEVRYLMGLLVSYCHPHQVLGSRLWVMLLYAFLYRSSKFINVNDYQLNLPVDIYCFFRTCKECIQIDFFYLNNIMVNMTCRFFQIHKVDSP